MSSSEIKNIFQHFSPHSLEGTFSHSAAVNLILFLDDEKRFNLLFIQRALSPEDRWSGQIGFPGGKTEKSDLSLLHTALRETAEEVHLSLSAEHLVGQLSDIQGRKSGELLPFYIRPFVTYLTKPPKLKLSAEVADTLTVPLESLFEKERHIAYPPRPELPAIRLSDDHLLWGLSYLMVTELAELWAQHYSVDISFWGQNSVRPK